MATGGNPPLRPDQALRSLSRAGSGPAPQASVITPRQVIVSGPGGGIFVYNATRTALESSDVGAATTDPVLGIACPQGFATYNSHGKVINLLSTVNNAFFQYNDAGAVQGILILAVASTAGTDPIGGASYVAGLNGIDPAFGDTILTVGANIALSQVAYTRSAQVAAFAGSVAARPVLLINGPEQVTASHTQIEVFGESPNGATAAQILAGATSGATLLASFTTALFEVQGTMTANSIGAIVSGAAETWHNLSPTPAGWTGRVSYRQLTEVGDVMVDINVNVANTTVITNSETVATVPAAYRPAGFKNWAVGFFNGATTQPQMFSVSPGGLVAFGGTGFTAGATCNFQGQLVYSIDASLT